MTAPAVAMLVTLLTLACAEAGGPGDSRALTWAPLPLDPDSPAVAAARFQLEIRRARGPRPEAVNRILNRPGLAVSTVWSLMVTQACRERVVDCRDFLGLAEGLEQRVPQSGRGMANHHLALMRFEAHMYSLSADARVALYRRALRSGNVRVAGWDLDDASASIRALDEGMDELIPEIEAWLKDQQPVTKQVVGEGLIMRRASTATSPQSALCALVDRGAAVDVERLLSRSTGGQEPLGQKVDQMMGRAAARALVRLAPEGAEECLRKAYERYSVDLARQHKEREDILARAKAENRSPRPGEVPDRYVLRGDLPVGLVEAIGDLGDRDFERTVFRELLDRPTLWDQVQAVEVKLVEEGKLGSHETVTR